jgi:hypothetical protein
MGRLIAGAATGVIVWFVAVAVLGQVLVHAWPEFAAIKDWTLYTTQMLAARLAVSFIATLLGGFAAAWIAKGNQRAALSAGIVLLLIFVWPHTTMWWRLFPLWYHLTFFVSLLVLSVIGGRFAPSR